MDDNFNLKMKLPNIPNIELVAIEGLERMGKYLGISNEKIGEARIIVNEAIINGFEHSGTDNPYVSVEFEMTIEKLTILVTDYGKGFVPDEVPVPDLTKKMHGENKRGWGIKLMKSLSDFMTIESSASGTKISIIKNLT